MGKNADRVTELEGQMVDVLTKVGLLQGQVDQLKNEKVNTEVPQVTTTKPRSSR